MIIVLKDEEGLLIDIFSPSQREIEHGNGLMDGKYVFVGDRMTDYQSGSH